MDSSKITVHLPEELNRLLTTYSNDIGCSKARLIHKIISAYFADMKNVEISFSPKLDSSDRNSILNNFKRKIVHLV
ncbi:MAG: hypothetical protein ACOY90_01535 [Candidatus Zhuqueibacterota bacterium]